VDGPRTASTDCEFKNADLRWNYNECAEWQSGPSQKYEPGQNHIVLELHAYTQPDDHPAKEIRPDEYDGYLGDISITYNCADMKSADKL
jgi:hypothetical protein